MRAVRLHGFGDESVLSVDDVPTPEPGADEVRVKVAGATVNRTDINTRLNEYGLPEPGPEGYGLGMDVAGVVDAVGAGVTTVAVGDRVVGFSGAPQERGAQAEFVVLPADAVTAAPRTGSLVEAAGLPLNGLTAVQAVEALPGGPGTVVVTGAAGGLGQMVVQVAHNAGHRVIAWVRPGTDADYVVELGADEVVTGADGIPARSVEAVIDAANLGQPTIDLIADGGRFVTFRGADPALDRGVERAVVWVHPAPEQLRKLVSDVDAGALQLPEATAVPLADVASAQRTFDAGGVRARLVLVP